MYFWGKKGVFAIRGGKGMEGEVSGSFGMLIFVYICEMAWDKKANCLRCGAKVEKNPKSGRWSAYCSKECSHGATKEEPYWAKGVPSEYTEKIFSFDFLSMTGFSKGVLDKWFGMKLLTKIAIPVNEKSKTCAVYIACDLKLDCFLKSFGYTGGTKWMLRELLEGRGAFRDWSDEARAKQALSMRYKTLGYYEDEWLEP